MIQGFLSDATTEAPTEEVGQEASDSDSDDFDMTCYDDDGQPLVDDAGQTLIPFDPELTYEEEESIWLCAFAGTYREVRGQLQATRIGRDQKVVKTKGSSKGPPRKKTFFKPGSAPKRANPEKPTAFKKKVGGTTKRGTTSDLKKRTKCFRCGKLGHMARDCKSDPKSSVSKPKGSGAFFQFQQSPAAYLFTGMTQAYEGGRYTEQSSLNEVVAAIYTAAFAGLVTRPCHALVDTGAQEGVVGLWQMQRWMICLALLYRLQPRFIEHPHIEAGGIGGSAKVLAVCEMPAGIGGVIGLTRWTVLEEPSLEARVPPLLPIKFLKAMDCAHYPKDKLLAMRAAQVEVELDELPTEHQSALMMDFGSDGWNPPDAVLAEFGGENPYELGQTIGQEPVDSRLDINQLLQFQNQYISFAELQDLSIKSVQMQFPSRPIPEAPLVSDSRPVPQATEAVPHISNSFTGFQEDDHNNRINTSLDNKLDQSYHNQVTSITDKSTSLSKFSLVPSLLSPKQRRNGSKWPKDTWSRKPGCWIRHHNRPRRALFLPTGTVDGPNASILSCRRLTRVDVPGAREPEDIRDDWLEGQDKQLYRRWTGCTVFFLRGSAETEASDCKPLPEQRNLSSSDGALDSLDSLVTPMLDVLLGTSRRDKIDTPPTNKQSPIVDHAIAKAEYDMERQEQQLDYRIRVALHPHLLECESSGNYVSESTAILAQEHLAKPELSPSATEAEATGDVGDCGAGDSSLDGEVQGRGASDFGVPQ